MGVSWTRTQVRRVYPSDATIEARVLDVAQRYAPFAVQQVQAKVWNYGRFVYRNLRPKPSFSKSERAWMGWAEKIRNGEIHLILSNPATDRRGTNYPKYVHLAGRPRSDLLMNEVHDLMERDIAPKLANAVQMAVVDALVKAGTKRTTMKWEG